MKVNKEYTPGEWSVDDKNDVISEKGKRVCMVSDWNNMSSYDPYPKANARLIASAPALVDALEQFYNYMRHSKEDAPTQKWEEEFEDLEQIAALALLKAGVITDQD